MVRTLVDPEMQTEQPTVEIRGPAHVADVAAGDRFQPDRLPDPGGAVVPDLVRPLLPILLASWLRQIERLILGADDDHLIPVAGRQHRGNIGGERRVPTFMPDD
jgi:hypothetical protein